MADETLGIRHISPADATHGPVASLTIGATVTGRVEALVDARASRATLKLNIGPARYSGQQIGLEIYAEAEVLA